MAAGWAALSAQGWASSGAHEEFHGKRSGSSIPRSISVSLDLDEAHSVAAVIDRAIGGTLQTTDSNGVRYTLTIPSGALSDTESETIRLTPIEAIPDLPLGGGFTAGAVVEPQDVGLVKPVQLAIDTPVRAGSLGFAFRGAGHGFHAVPATGFPSPMTFFVSAKESGLRSSIVPSREEVVFRMLSLRGVGIGGRLPGDCAHLKEAPPSDAIDALVQTFACAFYERGVPFPAPAASPTGTTGARPTATSAAAGRQKASVISGIPPDLLADIRTANEAWINDLVLRAQAAQVFPNQLTPCPVERQLAFTCTVSQYLRWLTTNQHVFDMPAVEYSAELQPFHDALLGAATTINVDAEAGCTSSGTGFDATVYLFRSLVELQAKIDALSFLSYLDLNLNRPISSLCGGFLGGKIVIHDEYLEVGETRIMKAEFIGEGDRVLKSSANGWPFVWDAGSLPEATSPGGRRAPAGPAVPPTFITLDSDTGEVTALAKGATGVSASFTFPPVFEQDEVEFSEVGGVIVAQPPWKVKVDPILSGAGAPGAHRAIVTPDAELIVANDFSFELLARVEDGDGEDIEAVYPTWALDRFLGCEMSIYGCDADADGIDDGSLWIWDPGRTQDILYDRYGPNPLPVTPNYSGFHAIKVISRRDGGAFNYSDILTAGIVKVTVLPDEPPGGFFGYWLAVSPPVAPSTSFLSQRETLHIEEDPDVAGKIHGTVPGDFGSSWWTWSALAPNQQQFVLHLGTDTSFQRTVVTYTLKAADTLELHQEYWERSHDDDQAILLEQSTDDFTRQEYQGYWTGSYTSGTSSGDLELVVEQRAGGFEEPGDIYSDELAYVTAEASTGIIDDSNPAAYLWVRSRFEGFAKSEWSYTADPLPYANSEPVLTSAGNVTLSADNKTMTGTFDGGTWTVTRFGVTTLSPGRRQMGGAPRAGSEASSDHSGGSKATGRRPARLSRHWYQSRAAARTLVTAWMSLMGWSPFPPWP